MNMKKFEADCTAWINAHREDMVEDLKSFVRIPSVSRADLAQEGAPFGPKCREMLDFALAYAEKHGFETECYDGYMGAAYMGDGKNAIGIIAHLDVVPEGNDWRWPPYSAHEEGDYLYGRGTDDNKSAAIVAFYVMKMLREMGIPLRHGVKLLLGLSEETGMQDMAYVREHYPQPVFTLVPDGGFPVNYAQKGSLNCNITRAMGDSLLSFDGGEVPNMVPPHASALVRCDPAALAEALKGDERICVTAENGLARVNAKGLAAHASTPENGKNAFAILSDALLSTGLICGESEVCLRAIRDVSLDIHGEAYGIACEDPDTGKTTMCIGVAGSAGTDVTLSVDCRLSIACDQDEVKRTLTESAAKNGFALSALRSTKPMYIPKDDPKVQALQALYFDMTGDPAEPYSMGGGTYARTFDQALTFGPGGNPISKGTRPDWLPEGHGGAHSPDEYVYIPAMLDMARIYAGAVLLLDELL